MTMGFHYWNACKRDKNHFVDENERDTNMFCISCFDSENPVIKIACIHGVVNGVFYFCVFSFFCALESEYGKWDVL